MIAKTLTIRQVAAAIGATVQGDDEAVIRGAASIDSATSDEITFAADARRVKRLPACKAGAVLVAPDVASPAGGLTLLRVADPEAAFAAVLALLAPPEDLPAPGVHPTAIVDATAELGPGVAIGPHAAVGAGATLGEGVVLCANAVVGAGAVIGARTVLFAGVVVRERCTIGRRCRLHPNVVIGSDGFGYYFRDGVHHKVPHIGTVQIGDDVELGACSCVDRGKFGVTRVGDGVKADNLVQVGHNARIGRGALLVAHVAIGGSVELGDYVALGGHVVVRDNVTVGPGVQAAGCTAIAQDLAGGQEVSGIPAMPAKQHYRALKVYAKLPEMRKQLNDLQARVNALEGRAKNDSP